MDSEGNLTVSFNNAINYPKYILNSFNWVRDMLNGIE